MGFVAVSHAATLLVILSESYLTSEWCQRELALFLQAAAQLAVPQGASFWCEWTLSITTAGLKHFMVCLDRGFSSRPTTTFLHALGTPLANDPEKRLYFQRLDDLSRELATKLLEMKQAAEISAASPGTQPSQRRNL